MLSGATYLDIAHAEAIREENRRNCKAVDKLYEPRKGAYGTGRERRDKVKRAPNTIHDLGQTNEFVRLLLKRAQDNGSLGVWE